MDEAQTAVVKALHRFADEIEKDELRVVNWSTRYEIIEVPTTGEWAENRHGPRSKIEIDFEATKVLPADTAAGEISHWQEAA